MEQEKVSKYYTPQIEELRVGLECVHTTLSNGFTEQGGFLEPQNHYEDDLYVGPLYPFDLRDLFEYFGQDAVDNVRVKYLDQKDFEDLGFIPSYGHNIWSIDLPETKYYKEGRCILRYMSIEPDRFDVDFSCEDFEGGYTLTDVLIRNKQQLRDFLKHFYQLVV